MEGSGLIASMETQIAEDETLALVTKGPNRKQTLARQAKRVGAQAVCGQATMLSDDTEMPSLGIGRLADFTDNPDWQTFQAAFGHMNIREGSVNFPGEMVCYHVTPDEMIAALQQRVNHPISERTQLLRAYRSLARSFNGWLMTQRNVSTERGRYVNFTRRFGSPLLGQLLKTEGGIASDSSNLRPTQEHYDRYVKGDFLGVKRVSRQEELEYSFTGFDGQFWGISFDDFDESFHSEHNMVISMLRAEIGRTRAPIGNARWEPRMQTFQITKGKRLGEQTFTFPDTCVAPIATMLGPVRDFFDQGYVMTHHLCNI